MGVTYYGAFTYVCIMNSEGSPISLSSAWNKLHEVHACVHMEPVIGDVTKLKTYTPTSQDTLVPCLYLRNYCSVGSAEITADGKPVSIGCVFRCAGLFHHDDINKPVIA